MKYFKICLESIKTQKFRNFDVVVVDDPIPHWINTLLTNPIVQATEIIGATFLILLFIKNKLYKLEELINYLKTSSKIPPYIRTSSEQEIQLVEE